MKSALVFPWLMALVFGVVASANAALVDRGGGLIYDPDFDITWLQDTNYAQTSGYDSDDVMTWYEAMAWAEDLEFAGYDDWRLPDAHNSDGSGPDLGYNVTDSELGHIYYTELGNSAYGPLENTGPFQNLTTVDDYWTRTEQSVPLVWVFDFDGGHQFYLGKGATNHAWAVRDGDSWPVPIPAAVWLLSSGLIGLVGIKRRFTM
ncbi:MAG: DUF1566 domain-containing protein [Thermodesulfobacteriota bacterium]|nr:DUF1566 domain-containing protein [Thermodesulfobacteriota bacterium]